MHTHTYGKKKKYEMHTHTHAHTHDRRGSKVVAVLKAIRESYDQRIGRKKEEIYVNVKESDEKWPIGQNEGTK